MAEEKCDRGATRSVDTADSIAGGIIELIGKGWSDRYAICLTLERWKDDILEADRSRQRELIGGLLEIIERGIPDPSHVGSCGPESGCDGVCVELSSIGEMVKRAHRYLKTA